MVGSLKNTTKSARPTTHGLLFFKEIRLFNFAVLMFLVFTILMPTAEAAGVGLRQGGTMKSFLLPRSVSNGTDFDWEKLTPSPNLTWVNCKTGRECARLEVPLDYSAPNGEKAAVALIRLKSKVPPNSKEYRGPVLFNPGGPGISGVLFIDQQGDEFQQLLGDGYDIVGFDPRGIGQTTPAVTVFSDTAERAAWDGGEPPLINSTADSLPRLFSRALLFNQLVEARSKKSAQHVSTAVVARDMLSIVKAHGRDRLQFWGVSYGTLMGATFAAMFPDKVERMIIDGVVDFDDYVAGSWSTGLFDTDKGLQVLYDLCASAGPACPLHADSGELVKERVDAILASVKANPVPITNGSTYAVVDFTTLKQTLLGTLYAPFQFFPLWAGAMAALEAGNRQQILDFFSSPEQIPTCDSQPTPGSFGKESSLAARCSDAEISANSTAEIMQHFDELSRSSILADVWIDSTFVACAGWRVKAAERFAGPFSANTSFPLLVIGNTADPVAPLAGAQKAAQGFGGSALLTINTPGHGSGAAQSRCANTVIRDYFNQGKLPEKGIVCEIEDDLFGQKWPTTSNSTVAGTA